MLDLDEVYFRILDYIDDGEYELALRQCNRILKALPNDASAFHYKAECLMYTRKYEEAIKCFEKAIELEPDVIDNDERLFYIGKCLIYLEKYEEAIEKFDIILIDYDKKDSYSLFYKGVACERLEKYDDAMKCYDEMLKINSKDYKAFGKKGYIKFVQKKYEEAISYFDKSIKFLNDLDDDFFENIYSYKNLALEYLGRYKEAITGCDILIKNEKDSIPKYLQNQYDNIEITEIKYNFIIKKAFFLLKTNHKDEAINFLKNIFKYMFNNFSSLFFSLIEDSEDSITKDIFNKIVENTPELNISNETNDRKVKEELNLSDFLEEEELNLIGEFGVTINDLIDDEMINSLKEFNINRKKVIEKYTDNVNYIKG